MSDDLADVARMQSLVPPGHRLLSVTALPRNIGVVPKAYWWLRDDSTGKVRLVSSPLTDMPPEELVRLAERVRASL